jgi:hypothetical protein
VEERTAVRADWEVVARPLSAPEVALAGDLVESRETSRWGELAAQGDWTRAKMDTVATE